MNALSLARSYHGARLGTVDQSMTSSALRRRLVLGTLRPVENIHLRLYEASRGLGKPDA